MMNKEFFPSRPDSTPTIYAYELDGVSTHTGLLKIGYTDRDAKTGHGCHTIQNRLRGLGDER